MKHKSVVPIATRVIHQRKALSPYENEQTDSRKIHDVD